MSMILLSDWYPAMYAQWAEARDAVPRSDYTTVNPPHH